MVLMGNLGVFGMAYDYNPSRMVDLYNFVITSILVGMYDSTYSYYVDRIICCKMKQKFEHASNHLHYGIVSFCNIVYYVAFATPFT